MRRANLIKIKERFLTRYERWIKFVNNDTSYGLVEVCRDLGFYDEKEYLQDRYGKLLIEANAEPMEVELKLLDWALENADE